MITTSLFNRNWMTLNVVRVDLVRQEVTDVDSGRVEYIVQFPFYVLMVKI
jgi:hypothetical protein